MGDDSPEESSESTSYADPSASTATEEQAPAHDASGSAGDPETLLGQAGQFFAAGNYQQAIEVVKPLYEAKTNDAIWGRATYGMVMCYEKIPDMQSAQRCMGEVVAFVTSQGWDATQYQQQLQGYQAGHPWHGEPLLI